METEKRDHRMHWGVSWGILVIIVGLLYLFSNWGFLPMGWKDVVLSWKTIVIVIGVMNVIYGRHVIFGSALIVFGVLHLLPNLLTSIGLTFPDNIFEDAFWPLVLIFIGAAIISHSLSHPRSKRKYQDSYAHNDCFRGTKRNCVQDGYITYNFLFSGTEEIFLEPVFKGGKISAVFGGGNIDFRKTTLPEGETTLQLDLVFGGINLIIPEEWDVQVRSSAICGAYVDKRSANGPVSDRKLIVEANCFLGGGDIKC